VKITAHVFVHNHASARVLEKCGFEQEGLLRKHYLKDGKYLDARLYSLLRCGE
jgi:RimJ/RimL family protein N-acetyltransferase